MPEPAAAPLDGITPLILTYNEEANIARTLAGLAWARRIVVIDSGSTDRTLEVLAADPRVEVIHRPFDNFADQCNVGLEHIQTPWVLSLDADYHITAALQSEIQGVLSVGSRPEAGFRIPFRYCVAGRPLRGAILPPRIALYRPDDQVQAWVAVEIIERRANGAHGGAVHPHPGREPTSQGHLAQV